MADFNDYPSTTLVSMLDSVNLESDSYDFLENRTVKIQEEPNKKKPKITKSELDTIIKNAHGSCNLAAKVIQKKIQDFPNACLRPSVQQLCNLQHQQLQVLGQMIQIRRNMDQEEKNKKVKVVQFEPPSKSCLKDPSKATLLRMGSPGSHMATTMSMLQKTADKCSPSAQPAKTDSLILNPISNKLGDLISRINDKMSKMKLPTVSSTDANIKISNVNFDNESSYTVQGVGPTAQNNSSILRKSRLPRWQPHLVKKSQLTTSEINSKTKNPEHTNNGNRMRSGSCGETPKKTTCGSAGSCGCCGTSKKPVEKCPLIVSKNDKNQSQKLSKKGCSCLASSNKTNENICGKENPGEVSCSGMGKGSCRGSPKKPVEKCPLAVSKDNKNQSQKTSKKGCSCLASSNRTNENICCKENPGLVSCSGTSLSLESSTSSKDCDGPCLCNAPPPKDVDEITGSMNGNEFEFKILRDRDRSRDSKRANGDGKEKAKKLKQNIRPMTFTQIYPTNATETPPPCVTPAGTVKSILANKKNKFRLVLGNTSAGKDDVNTGVEMVLRRKPEPEYVEPPETSNMHTQMPEAEHSGKGGKKGKKGKGAKDGKDKGGGKKGGKGKKKKK